MGSLLHQLITGTAERAPDRQALIFKGTPMSYEGLSAEVGKTACGLVSSGLGRQDRVAVYLDKRMKTVLTIFGAAAAGGVFVPVNPLLKAEQVAYILKDCNVRILITSKERLRSLSGVLSTCEDLGAVVIVDDDPGAAGDHPIRVMSWEELTESGNRCSLHRSIDSDMAAILYTSGSTGKPKGVVLSHRNMVAGAKSVAEYLENRPDDRILAVLPFSFDYGLSQLTTAFWVGASAVLHNYLLPRDVLTVLERERITGLAAVPPLWIQLAQLEWPGSIARHLRYITNSGGAMPTTVVAALKEKLPSTQIYLMYGLTEAFRSTYLPPDELDKRPDSIGKAIPNAEILVINEHGRPCKSAEAGELVHRGALVALGYWNDPEKTAERFKPLPGQAAGLTLTEIAVWSGDTVSADEDGFLYFIGRRDEMIKTSGYRVSPTEIEEVIYATGLVGEAVAFGIPHPVLGQSVVVVATPESETKSLDGETLLNECKRRLPAFMVPAHVLVKDALPRNPNGKIDRRTLAAEAQERFAENG